MINTIEAVRAYNLAQIAQIEADNEAVRDGRIIRLVERRDGRMVTSCSRKDLIEQGERLIRVLLAANAELSPPVA